MNWNVIVSPTCAVIFAGSKINLLGPPTITLWSVETPAVGAAEPGYDPYVVTTWEPPTVTVAVTVTTLGEAAAEVDAAGGAVAETALPMAAALNASN